MTWKRIGEVPDSLLAAGLTLEQANEWQGYFARSKALGSDQGDAAARAWLKFKARHTKKAGIWE